MIMRLLRNFVVGAGLWLAAAAPAGAAWLRAESPHFIVYSEQNERRLREQMAVLEDYAALLRRIGTGRPEPSPNKLRVYLVRTHGELRQVRPVPDTIGGFYVAGPEGIGAFVNTNAGGDLVSANEVLFHEYAHHFMMQYYNSAYPAWYTEGFAEYVSTARFTDRHVEFGHISPIRASWLADRSAWLPMVDIVFGRENQSEIDRARFYAQSWLLTHYLHSNRERQEQFRSYLTALGRAEEPRQAFEASFGMRPDQLQREVANYGFRGGMHFLRIDRASIAQAPQITITPLPPSANDLMLQHATIEVGAHDPAALLARVRRHAARHNDPFARRVHAAAEAIYGDKAVAERLLGELLAESPNDAELLYYRGMRHLTAAEDLDAEARTAQFRLARNWFSRAHRANANHFQTLYRYAQSFTDEPEFVSENNLNILLLAHQLAPQVDEIRMNAAAMLLLRRDFELAEALLRPLTGTAHQGPLAAAARAMLEKARAQDAEGVAVSFEPEEEEDSE